ncbi:hypothetical protein DFH06DRAFT_1151221 [Mycena polygramma]|nr:hypothetical protein DFH06DRAFT_1151221 [Mycena polygramma]
MDVRVERRAAEMVVVDALPSDRQSASGARAESGEPPRRAEANVLAVADAARTGEAEPAPPALEDAEVQQAFCDVKKNTDEAATPDAVSPQPNDDPPTPRAFAVLPLAAGHAIGVPRLQPDPPREFRVGDAQRAPEKHIHLPNVCVEVDIAGPFPQIWVHELGGDIAEDEDGEVGVRPATKERESGAVRELGGGAYAAGVGGAFIRDLSPSESAVEPVESAPSVTQEGYGVGEWVPEDVEGPWGGEESHRAEVEEVKMTAHQQKAA